MVLETESPRLGCQLGEVLCESHFHGSDGWLLAVCSYGGGKKTLISLLLSIFTDLTKDSTPTSSSKFAYLPKALFLNTITLRIRAANNTIGRDNSI